MRPPIVELLSGARRPVEVAVLALVAAGSSLSYAKQAFPKQTVTIIAQSPEGEHNRCRVGKDYAL